VEARYSEIDCKEERIYDQIDSLYLTSRHEIVRDSAVNATQPVTVKNQPRFIKLSLLSTSTIIY